MVPGDPARLHLPRARGVTLLVPLEQTLPRAEHAVRRRRVPEHDADALPRRLSPHLPRAHRQE